MTRYFVVATIIVVAAFAAFAAWWMHRPQGGIKISSVDTTMAPRASNPLGKSGLGTGGFLADAAWAFSALPGCFTQTSVSRGPIAYVRSHLPKDAAGIAGGAKLSYGDCLITLEPRGAVVHRGADSLLVPAPVRLFRTATHLYVLHLDGTHAQLRAYVPSNM